MAKHKTNKSVKKRVRISKNGKVMHGKTGRRHLNSSHTRKTIRNLNRKGICHSGDAVKMLRMLGAVRP
jgi:large subunit ribosomal protein L35